MLLDLLTADAAAQHGHEYSPPRSPTPRPSRNGYSLTQMPLSILSSVIRGQNASPTDVVASPVDMTTTPVSVAATPKNLIGAHDLNGALASPPPSRPASSSSKASTEGRTKRRGHRPKTSFNLAQPPPITGPRQKLHIRPKVLLQLHQVVPSRRPKPVYEVIPFSLLAARSTRRLARTFNSKDRLGPNDLLIVKAEEYGNEDEEKKSDDERWGTREVIGIICPPKKSDKDTLEKTEVLMDDGSNWEVTNLPNGGYEFNFTDEHGLLLKSRWVPKPAPSRRASTMSSSSLAHASPTIGAEDKKFNFSTISANSRRHPVIATMSRASIDVLDSYTMPSATTPSSPGYPPSGVNTPALTPLLDSGAFVDTCNERLPVSTDDALRRFIVVSGIWVAFSENWSAAYSFSKNNACPSIYTPSTPRPSAPSRAVSMSFVDTPRSLSPASTIDETRRTIPKLFRAGTQRLQRNSSLTLRASDTGSLQTSPAPSPRVKTRSRRSNSTGNAELKSDYGSMRKRYGAAFENETLPETEEERQSKRSMELLRIRELALPDTPPATTTPTPVNLSPIKIVETSAENSLPSPNFLSPRATKARSAYEPVTTTGLWDSGVTDGPGLKKRPTSMFVVNEKKEKEKKKQARSKSKEKKKDKADKALKILTDKGVPSKSGVFKQRFLGIFRREKS